MKKFLYSVMLVLLSLGNSACSGDTSTDELIPDEYETILSLKQGGTETLTIDEESTDKYETNLVILKGGRNTHSVAKAKVGVFSNDELQAYNDETGVDYKIIPETCYSIEQKELVIGDESGETGVKVSLSIDRVAVREAINAFWEENPDLPSPYILPIRLASDDADILKDKKDLIIFFSYAKPIPPEPVMPEWYVETVKGDGIGNPFNGPRNLAVKDGYLYIVDNQETIKKMDLSTLAISDFYDLGKAPAITKAMSLTIGHDGIFYVGAGNGAWTISPEGVATKKVDGEIHDMVENPVDNQLFFINGGKSSIHIFDGDTNPSVSGGYEWWSEGQMAWDPTYEHVYVAIQGGKNQIDRYTYNKETKKFDTHDIALYTGDLLIHPRQMAFDSKGNMYVASKARHAVVKITPDGEIIKLAGSGTRDGIGNADGKALEATFNMPYGIALVENPDDPDHPTLYVGDTGNCAIRKIVYKVKEE